MPGPDKIMLIRHAEKPLPGSPGGVDESGSPDTHSLTVRGWQRAGALVTFFGSPTRQGIATPATIVASAEKHKTADSESGRRPTQTVKPLYARIGGTFVNDIPVGAEDLLTQRLRACTGVVLVAWEHRRLHHIVAGFVEDVAPEWDTARFDLVWILDRSSAGGYRLSSLNQNLLADDLPN